MTGPLAGIHIAYIGCETTLTHNPSRRVDAFEHDLEFTGLQRAFDAAGASLVEIDWRRPVEQPFHLGLVRTTWDYQHHVDEFLAFLNAAPFPLANGAEAIRWGLDKHYMLELAQAGLPVVPTISAASAPKRWFEEFGVDDVVIKPWIGASGEGQKRAHQWDLAHLTADADYMVQPFMPHILDKGEISLIFIQGQFSHGVLKKPSKDDYRIQSLYGGKESAYQPDERVIAVAQSFLDWVPDPWLAVRVDLVQDTQGAWRLMELETVEPYLYPLADTAFASRLVAAIPHYIRKHAGL